MKKLDSIALFLPSLAGGGAEKQVVLLANGLAAKGIKVDLVLTQAKGPYLSMVSDKVRIVGLKSSRVLFSLPKLISYLRKHKPKILFSAMDYANVMALIANFFAAGCSKCIVSIRTHVSTNVMHARSYKEKVIFYLAKFLYKKAALVLAVSHDVANDIIRAMNLPAALVNVVYNPVINDKLFELSNQKITNWWQSEQTEVPLILSVGRLEIEKNFTILIKAFAMLIKQTPARLLILGEGSLRHELQQLTEELDLQNSIKMPGFAANPYPHLKNCDLFVLSSNMEGLPGVLIEALALSPRIVATDCPGGTAEILERGKWGRLVAVGDIQGLATAMLESLRDQPTSINTAALARFKHEVIMEEYLKLFTSLL
jgi:glycosyltransferase involved in cell wall biosynthesis